MPAQPNVNIPILTDVIAAEARDENKGGTVVPSAKRDENTRDARHVDAILEDDATVKGPDVEILIAELQTRLATSTFALTEELMRTAFSEMEAKVYHEISARLRRELPELIDSLLREHLRSEQDR
jgi:hypothetical protein